MRSARSSPSQERSAGHVSDGAGTDGFFARRLSSPAMTETKVLLPESALPDRWYNITADMPNRPQPVLHPGTGQPVGPDDLAPLFPMELILQEVSEAPEIAIPEPVRRDPPPLAPDAPLPRPSPRAGARDEVADLLQVRGRLPGGEPQAEHRRRAGVLLEAGRPRAPRHRDRGRASGEVPWRWPAGSWASSARSTWSRSRTTRSRTGAR